MLVKPETQNMILTNYGPIYDCFQSYNKGCYLDLHSIFLGIIMENAWKSENRDADIHMQNHRWTACLPPFKM